MADIKFEILPPNDFPKFELIADWYLNEWNIPVDRTIQRLSSITEDRLQFQVLMTIDDIPMATGGLYNHVGLLDKVPEFKIYKNWLALVYTIPTERKKGYGAILCTYIQEHAASLGIEKLYLFTDTAEQLYKRLGWIEMERVAMGERRVVVMSLEV